MNNDIKKTNLWLMKGDCLERMKEIPSGSVDMVLTDPPYGTMNNAGLDGWENNKTSWDTLINQEKMLEECNRVLRVNGSLLLFAQDPFTGDLMTKQHGNLPFSYRMTWLKDHFANALIAKKAPVNYTEDICVFFKKYDLEGLHPLRMYFKMVKELIGLGLKDINKQLGHRRAEHCFYLDSTQFGLCTEKTYNELVALYGIDKQGWFKPFSHLVEVNRKFNRKFNLWDGKKFKSNVLSYKKDYQRLHPTQKPVLLLEDLIKTYTNEGETVLDFCLGSGTTGVACKNLNRKFIGIEMDEGYFNIAKDRINNVPKNTVCD